VLLRIIAFPSDQELSIGTSSIFLKYNTAALSFLEYTSKQFDGSSQCIQDVASAWDVQTYQNTSFNSSDPNTGTNLIEVKEVKAINGSKELQCEGEGQSDCASMKELWEETTVTLSIQSCNDLANFCTGVPYNNAKVYDFTVNEMGTEDIDRCENGETSFFYTYSSFLKLEQGGDFEGRRSYTVLWSY